MSYVCNGMHHIRLEFSGAGFSLHRSTSKKQFATLDALVNHYIAAETRDGVLQCRIIAPPPTGFDLASAKRASAAAAATTAGASAASSAGTVGDPYEENVLLQLGGSTTISESVDDGGTAPAPFDLWYFGALKSAEYTRLLMDAGDKSFLVRDSSSGDGLVLVVNEGGDVANYPITVSVDLAPSTVGGCTALHRPILIGGWLHCTALPMVITLPRLSKVAALTLRLTFTSSSAFSSSTHISLTRSPPYSPPPHLSLSLSCIHTRRFPPTKTSTSLQGRVTLV